MAASVLDIPGNIDLEAKAAMLAQRRSVLLAIVGSTSSSSETVRTVLSNGFLGVVKSWLDDVLSSVVGGTDLLLHLLDSITNLPVTKEMITQSNAGKAVAAVKTHSICKGTPNESAIKERVAKLKEEWSASVRARKNEVTNKSAISAKRPAPAPAFADGQSLPKKAKPTIAHSPPIGAKKSSSLSSLLQKVGDKPSPPGTSSAKTSVSAADAARQKAKERDADMKKRLASLVSSAGKSGDEANSNGSSIKEGEPAVVEEKKSSENDIIKAEDSPSSDAKPKKNKSNKSVSWADQSGKALEEAHEFSGELNPSEKLAADKPAKTLGSWSERRKRDRMREKELLAEHRAAQNKKLRYVIFDLTNMCLAFVFHRKYSFCVTHSSLNIVFVPLYCCSKAKLLDEGDDMDIVDAPTMTPTVRWNKPAPLPPSKENPPPPVDSKEFAVQTARMATVPPVMYLTDDDVPSNPNPLSDIEQALELTSQASSSSPESMPWVPPPPQPQAAAVPAAAAALPGLVAGAYAPVAPTGATVEMLQSMGLPLFLVGSNIQALNTLAASPSLLQTFLDANGLYDQPRLMNLVQTLTQNLAPSQPQVAAVPGYQPPAALAMSSHYGVAANTYQPPAATLNIGNYGGGGGGGGGAYRGDKNEAGNMHVSGYGPTTTEHEIRALFEPYVHVDEVVMKSNFSFVNTRDPTGAAQAREILSGSLLGGMPIRVNAATRRPKGDSGSMGGGLSAPVPAPAPPLPRDITGQVQYDQVRDDRGNAATKNLFVAGYGMGTTEQQLREIFAPHCNVTSIVMKSSFSFVNTSDRKDAIHAREALIGAVLNGSPLRINFAKETGRLGTSFDTSAYGPGSGGY